MDVSKKYVETRLLKMFVNRSSLDGVNYTDQHISARSFLIFALGWAVCGRPQPEHESVMPLLSLSTLNVFNPLKLYHVPGNIFRKWLTSYLLFIHEHLIIM